MLFWPLQEWGAERMLCYVKGEISALIWPIRVPFTYLHLFQPEHMYLHLPCGKNAFVNSASDDREPRGMISPAFPNLRSSRLAVTPSTLFLDCKLVVKSCLSDSQSRNLSQRVLSCTPHSPSLVKKCCSTQQSHMLHEAKLVCASFRAIRKQKGLRWPWNAQT